MRAGSYRLQEGGMQRPCQRGVPARTAQVAQLYSGRKNSALPTHPRAAPLLPGPVLEVVWVQISPIPLADKLD